MEKGLSVVGKDVPKIEAVGKATGTLRYTSDIFFPNMLYAKILRSPYAHARVKRIDTSKAQKLQGVKSVLTFKDVPQEPYGLDDLGDPANAIRDKHILEETARYVGDRIAVVAANDIETCQKALEMIDVEYEELPAVFEVGEALKSGAPRVHDYYVVGGRRIEPRNNIATVTNHGEGDVEMGFKRDGTLVSQKYDVTYDIGGYDVLGAWVVSATTGWTYSMYRSPHFSYEGRGVYTNTPPPCAFRGFGNPQANFAIESAMDQVAEELGVDPIDLRLKNYRRKGDLVLAQGQRVKDFV